MKPLIACWAVLFVASTLSPGQSSSKGAELTKFEMRALTTAIEDEIYDYEYEGHYFPVGGAVGNAVSDSKTRVSLYVDARLENGEGQTIYKLMPYGEVLRLFHVHDDGMVVLDGDPELGFPATQPNRKTVYINDHDLARMKRDWLKALFEISLSPGAQRVQDAVRRQKERTGFSAWEFHRAPAARR